MSRWDYDILYPKRNGSWRIIKAGKWYINRDTPLGCNAELWERMPHDGRKALNIRHYMEITKDGTPKCSCGMEWKPEYNDRCPRCKWKPPIPVPNELRDNRLACIS